MNKERCSYTLDLSESDPSASESATDKSWTLSDDDTGVWDGAWHCPHTPADGFEKCTFHLPPSDLPDQIDITERFLTAVETANNRDDRFSRRRGRQFIGATFAEFDLEGVKVGGGDAGQIDLRYATFERVNCHRTRFDQDIRFSKSVFRAPDTEDVPGNEMDERENVNAVGFRGAEFARRADFRGATFEDAAGFEGALFKQWTGFRDTKFEDTVDFHWATFSRLASFPETVYEGFARFRYTDFEAYAQFNDAEFENVVSFEGAIFDDDSEFARATFLDTVEFDEAIARRNLSFHGACIREDASLTDATIEATLDLTDTMLSNSVALDHMTVQSICIEPILEMSVNYVDLTKTEIDEGTIAQPTDGRVVYDCTDATLGSLKFIDPSHRDLLDWVYMKRTQFDGFDFNDGDDIDLVASDYTIHELADKAETAVPGDDVLTTDCSTLWTTYLYAKNGVQLTGDKTAAGKFFFKEMVYRRKDHFERALTPPQGVTTRTRLSEFSQWARSLVFSGLAGYGERPDRVVISSLVIIAFYAPLYGIITDGTPLLRKLPLYSLLSFQSFVTFLLGSPPIETTLAGSVLGATEGFLGAFMIALFVFALTRRVQR